MFVEIVGFPNGFNILTPLPIPVVSGQWPVAEKTAFAWPTPRCEWLFKENVKPELRPTSRLY